MYTIELFEALVLDSKGAHSSITVIALQKLLNNELKTSLKVDGWLGPKTEAAVNVAIATLKLKAAIGEQPKQEPLPEEKVVEDNATRLAREYAQRVAAEAKKRTAYDKDSGVGVDVFWQWGPGK